MTLIGIAGAKRSGKDTLANGLSMALGVPRESFAGPLREFVARITGMTLAQLEFDKELALDWLDGVTPRSMMQTVGTEWGRQMVHPDLWVRSLLARIPPQGAIISDVRFDNEASAILDRGGMVLRVLRPGLATGDAHISEIPVSDHLVTAELVNSRTPHDLVASAMALIEPARLPNPVSQVTGD